MPQENNPYPYPYHHSCIIIFIILLSLIHLISSSTDVETHYGACPPLKSICNFPQNITYPFFDGSRPDYCGRTGFKVDCIDDQSGNLAININNETYKINSINYTSKSLTVTKQQFLQGPCPAATDPLTNTTFGTTPFDLTSNSQNLALFYNCSSKLDSNTPVYFKCGGYRDNDSYELMINSTYNYVAIDEKQENEIEGLLCDVKIYLPVLRDEASDLAKNSTGVIIDDVVSKGFELKWVIDDSHCEKCEKSQGRCGYNETLKQTVCFCREAVYYDYQTCPTNSTATALAASPLNSPVGKTGMSGSAVGVIVAGALAAGSMIVGLLFFLNRRYRRRQSLSPDLQVSRKYNPGTFSATLDPNASTYFGVNVFTYKELEEATMFFDPGKVLGQGGFGTVYQGSLQDGREVAIKRLYENNSKRAEQFLNEVEILANLRHKNLVDLYGCTSRHGKELLLVYEYVPNGTVADHLHGRKAELRLLPWSARLRIAIETASALVYLHASDIIHRDVKTQNILLDTDFSVKVADFGLSRLFPLDATHVSTAPQGTPGYVDPEYHQYYQLTERSDVYSFGVVLAELISSKPAVDVTRRRTEINLSSMLRTKMQSGTLDEFVDPLLGFESDDIKKKVTAVANLAVQCLESTREMRPSMQQVLERLYNIQDEDDTSVRPEVFEIPSDDALMLKGDSSPSSPQRGDNSSRRNHVSA